MALQFNFDMIGDTRRRQQALLDEQALAEQQKLRADAALQQQAVGFSQQLNRQQMTGNPVAQTAVGLMQNPGSRAAGVQMAGNLLDPQAQANLQSTQQSTASSRQQEVNAQQGYQQAAQMFPLQMQAAKLNAAQSLAAIQASGLGSQAQQNTFYNTVRGQFQALPAIKNLGEAQSAYRAADAALGKGSALGARVAMIKLAKLADPTSVVREGEVENIRQGYGVLSQLDTALRTAGDKGLGAAQQAMFRDVMDSLYAPALELGSAAMTQYQGLENQYQARPGEFTNTTGIDWQLVPGKWRERMPATPGSARGVIKRSHSWGGQ